MCLPGVDASTSPEAFAGMAGAFAWAKAFEPLGVAGVYLSQVLQANRTGENNWAARPPFEPSTTSVTGEVVGDFIVDLTPGALELTPGVLELTGSASLLANNAFDGLVPDASNAVLASAVPGPNAPSAPFSDSPAAVSPTTVMDGAKLGDFLVEPPRASNAVSGTSGASSGASAASSSGSLYANELAQEHARFYSDSVAQADAAQQAEYVSNQASRAAAVQARIDSVMAQADAANARDVGYGPGVPAAPGYGPADVLASGQPASEVPLASGTGGQQPGLFARQGFTNDGRMVPNIFKVVNQDLWAGWRKSSGAEAVLTFPFVLAMSGAVFLPQSINDIPNIPTLLATALSETDNGNWGKGLEAAGDGLGALGMAGELAAGAEALSAGSNAAAETIDFSMSGGRLGGKLYPQSNLLKLEQSLAGRGIELKVGVTTLPEGAAAGFDGVDRVMVFRENPTILEIEHEMAHLEHFEKIGAEAYNNKAMTTRLMKEQFVFDKLSSSELWETLTDAERQLSKDYIEGLGGIY